MLTTINVFAENMLTVINVFVVYLNGMGLIVVDAINLSRDLPILTLSPLCSGLLPVGYSQLYVLAMGGELQPSGIAGQHVFTVFR